MALASLIGPHDLALDARGSKSYELYHRLFHNLGPHYVTIGMLCVHFIKQQASIRTRKSRSVTDLEIETMPKDSEIHGPSIYLVDF